MDNPIITPDSSNIISLSDEELRMKIQDAFYPILSNLTPDESSREVQLLLQDFLTTEAPVQEADFQPVLPSFDGNFRAIQNSDLSLFEQISGFFSDVIFSPELSPDKLKSNILSGLCKLIFKYWSKSIRLTYEQGIVLNLLKEFASPGLATDSIANMLSDKKALSSDDVQKVLDSLKHIQKTDGSFTSLVQETNGHWVAVDINLFL